MERNVLPPDLLQLVRTALRADPDELNSWEDDPINPKIPVLRKLVEQMHFSHKFILTYYGALGLLVLSFAINHRLTYCVQQKGHRTSGKGTGVETPVSNSSSSATTLLASGDSSIKDLDTDTERSPLLQGKVRLGRPESYGHIIMRHLDSFLLRQPRPIPALTAPSNQLPANGTSLVILLLLAINLFYLFYHVPLSIPMLFVFADRVGLLFVVNLPVLYILGAKTNQPLQYLTGWSYEGLNIFHRRLGEWMVAYGFLHGVAMFGVWYTLLRPFRFTLIRYLTARVVLLGIFSLVAYIAIWITSIGWVRYLYYEAFLGLHIVLQVAALVLLFFHHPYSRPYVIAALVIWAADRVASRMFLSKRKLVASLQIAEDQKTVLMFCEVPLRPSKMPIGANILHGWQPGQHVFVIVPGLGGWHSLQSHPFTIASPAPPADMKMGRWPLQLTIRAQDGFSKDLLIFAKHHQHTEVWLDGPYGSDEALQALRSADRTCLVAGGSGIAVTYPLACDRYIEVPDALVSARVVYENGVKRGPQDLVYAQSESVEHTHIWVRQDARADSWIGHVPKDVNVSESQSRRGVIDLINAKFETAGVHTRRPDIPTELRGWVMQGTRSQQKMIVVVSGPDSLVRDVRNAVATLVREGFNIEIHVEKFGW
jgi:hypothetical protein